MKTKWLNNQLGFIGCYTLCFNELQYRRIMTELKVPYPSKYKSVNETANAWVKTFVNARGSQTFLVCIDEKHFLTKSVPEMCGYMAHEATHVWQQSCDHIGEHSPSIEFEAYCIGHITEQLVSELFNHKFKRLVKCQLPSSRKK
jgi:hypothetical protein